MGESATLTISGLAREAGLRPDTVRYYERVGLMPTPERTSGEHRRYGEPALDRLRFIRGAQRLGLRLSDIADLLAVRDTGACPCEPAAPLLRSRIAEIDAEMARLTRLRADLVAMADQVPSATCPDPVPGTWCPPDHRVTGGRCDTCSS
ncbi:MerR family DNA-binding protein [Actinomycetospora sp.]|uniref:MerR family DNA-binding protein n=1 Tax=Actinomycetospora sp. TaxID=1872135 RepID=UPI002F3E9BED